MNSYLLDTHIWIWSLLNTPRINQQVAAVLLSTDSELWLSPISLWETLTLAEKGKIGVPFPASEWIAEVLHENRLELLEAPVTFDVANAMQTIETPHKDPADRFLAATAATLDLALITSDRNLLAGRGYKTLSNL